MSKINLRKSAAIQKELQTRIAEIEINSTVEVDEFVEPKEAVSKKLQEAVENIQLRTNLLTTLYSMRAKTAQMNSKCGVSALLAEEARLDHEIRMYAELSRNKARKDLLEIKGRIDKLKSMSHDTFSSRDSITVGLFDREQILTFKDTVKSLKKKKQQANDKLLELNVKKSIELTTEEEQVLSDEGLI